MDKPQDPHGQNLKSPIEQSPRPSMMSPKTPMMDPKSPPEQTPRPLWMDPKTSMDEAHDPSVDRAQDSP